MRNILCNLDIVANGIVHAVGHTASLGHITCGSIRTITGNIACTSRNIQTVNGTVVGKSGSFQCLPCSGNTGTLITNPNVVGVGLQRIIVSGRGYGWIEPCGSASGQAYIVVKSFTLCA